uniref:Uncharacterized protein n=1 Tax=Arundo donax TaxID=35708 RepID=A0A0A9BN87_ARUDO
MFGIQPPFHAFIPVRRCGGRRVPLFVCMQRWAHVAITEGKMGRRR